MFKSSKIFKLLIALVMLVVPLSLVSAQTPEDVEIQIQEFEDSFSDWEWEEDFSWSDEDSYTSTSYDYDYDDLAPVVTGLGAGAAVFGVVTALISTVIGLGVYIYYAFAMMTVAKKLNHPNPWFAWIPILNIVQIFQLADMSPWLILLALVPFLGALALMVITIIAMMKITEKRGYDKLLGLLTIVPIANFILVGILAWGKKEATPVATM